MTTPPTRARRPATRSRWAATGLTAAVTVGTVVAMTEAAESDTMESGTTQQALADAGTNLGVMARHEADVAAAAMMSAADPGEEFTAPPLPPRLGRADVS